MSAPDAALLVRRPISVKVDNASEARPQSGLASADVVYETLTEGGVTRFNAIFQSQLPKSVGPVRSARLSDASIVTQYHAILFSTGASSSVRKALLNASAAGLPQQGVVATPYARVGGKAAPHDVYVDARRALAAATRQGVAATASVPSQRFAISSSTATASPISGITVPFSAGAIARWTYEPRSASYARADNGSRTVDAASGHALQIRNVVVLWARYTPAARDKQGATTYDIVLKGTGRASVFHDGQRVDGTWQANLDSPPQLVSSGGSAIRLAVGSTWFEVIPLDANITLR
jgi:hypothetical protein